MKFPYLFYNFFIIEIILIMVFMSYPAVESETVWFENNVSDSDDINNSVESSMEIVNVGCIDICKQECDLKSAELYANCTSEIKTACNITCEKDVRENVYNKCLSESWEVTGCTSDRLIVMDACQKNYKRKLEECIIQCITNTTSQCITENELNTECNTNCTLRCNL